MQLCFATVVITEHLLLTKRKLTSMGDDVDQEERQRQLLSDYKLKLKLPSGVIPDPLTLSDSWMNEKDGIVCWPQLYFSDISQHLRKSHPTVFRQLALQ
jgi:hypothetical protein